MPPKTLPSSVNLLLFLVCCTILLGCGSGNTIALQGEVTFAGKPVPLGKIVFTPDTARGNSGPQGFATIEHGKFDTSARTGRGSVTGPVIVKIEGFDPAPAGGDAFLGKTLFSKPYEQPLDVSAGQGNLAIDIPGSHK